MRYVIIEDCDYKTFEEHRDEIYENNPWALLSAGYSKKLRKAVFCFNDSDYIPESMQQYIKRPSGHPKKDKK